MRLRSTKTISINNKRTQNVFSFCHALPLAIGSTDQKNYNDQRDIVIQVVIFQQ